MKVSPACDGCYAEAMMDKRYGRVEWGAPGKGNGTRERTSKSNWQQPIRWNKAAEAAGTRPFVFCASLADVFDNQVPAEWRADLFDLIRKTPHLVWLLLTKRPQNIIKLFSKTLNPNLPLSEFSYPRHWWPRNAAIGATCEDQERWDINIPHLVYAKKRMGPAFAFVSIEPMLSAINPRMAPTWPGDDTTFDPLQPGGIDWVITGGETDQGGHKARPSNPLWFRQLRDHCAESGIPFHHKQNGEWTCYTQIGASGWSFTREKGGVRYGKLSAGRDFNFESPLFEGADFPTIYPFPVPYDPGPCMVHVGKRRSGRLLDGSEHNDRPQVAA